MMDCKTLFLDGFGSLVAFRTRKRVLQTAYGICDVISEQVFFFSKELISMYRWVQVEKGKN